MKEEKVCIKLLNDKAILPTYGSIDAAGADLYANIEENDSVVVINEDATENNLIAKLAGEKCQSVIISIGNDVTNLFIVLTISGYLSVFSYNLAKQTNSSLVKSFFEEDINLKIKY